MGGLRMRDEVAGVASGEGSRDNHAMDGWCRVWGYGLYQWTASRIAGRAQRHLRQWGGRTRRMKGG